ncbi:MAG: translation initiation factor IF-2 [Verrucomicrobiota bacterium]|nr:translation initiation factor IF-2 [Chthoniobacteraceae bacterium]
MATRTPRSTTTPKTPAAPSAAPSASKQTARSKSAAATGLRGKSVEVTAPVPAPPTPPAPKQEALSLIDEKPKKKKVASVLRPFKALPSISKLNEPEVVEVPKEPEVEVAVEVAADHGARVEPVAEVLTEEVQPLVEDKVVHLKPPIGVRDLAAALKLRPFEVIRDLMGMNIFVNLNQTVEIDVASAVCKKHGFLFEREKREKGAGVHKQVEKVVEPPKVAEKPKAAEMKLRAPIVTFLGHVDHGKTTLMDAIRKARVAAGEAGGITQHIGAYSVRHKDHPITFLDTPGHAAFTAMRARGANITDIAVLVVAADDGIMPQTLEAISHAKAAKVQIIVAITKIDTTGANIDRVKGQLQEKGLSPEDWGGDVICVPVAAIKGQGVETLLESILLVAEVAELKATDGGVARATVIEAQVEQGRGPTATLIVRSGTLKPGDAFICGNYSGKVKSMLDDHNKQIKLAPPSTPVKIVGLTGVPSSGDELVVMESERAAEALSEERLNKMRMSKLEAPVRPTLESLFDSLADEKRKSLRVILKADVQGSSEALVTSLKQIQSKKIDLEMVHVGVGPITENDVLLAAASNAIVVGFNVKVENNAAQSAKREGVQVKLYSIIYELLDQVKEAMAGLLDPESRESVVGHAEVRRVFDLKKGCVAGSYVTDGRIVRSGRARVLRGRQPIYDGGLATLRRFQDDVKEVRNGMECGIRLGNFDEYEEGDIIECYILEKFAQSL